MNIHNERGDYMFWFIIGLAILGGIGNGMMDYKSKRYLSDKYDESKKK